MPQEVLGPRTQGGQAAVTGDGSVATLTLQMDQEVQDPLDGDLGERQPVDGSMGLLRQEGKEQSQGIPIGPDRVGTRPAGVLEVLLEEGLRQPQQGGDRPLHR